MQNAGHIIWVLLKLIKTKFDIVNAVANFQLLTLYQSPESRCLSPHLHCHCFETGLLSKNRTNFQTSSSMHLKNHYKICHLRATSEWDSWWKTAETDKQENCKLGLRVLESTAIVIKITFIYLVKPRFARGFVSAPESFPRMNEVIPPSRSTIEEP